MSVEALTQWILSIDSKVWAPFAMPLVLLIVGGLITIATGVVQIRRFPFAFRMMTKGAFARASASSGHVTNSVNLNKNAAFTRCSSVALVSPDAIADGAGAAGAAVGSARKRWKRRRAAMRVRQPRPGHAVPMA